MFSFLLNPYPQTVTLYLNWPRESETSLEISNPSNSAANMLVHKCQMSSANWKHLIKLETSDQCRMSSANCSHIVFTIKNASTYYLIFCPGDVSADFG